MKTSLWRIGCFTVFASMAGIGNGDAQSQQAVASQTFINSIGIDTHFANNLDPSTVWYNANFTQIASALTNLGIKNIRDGLVVSYASNPSSTYTTELTTLAKAGISVDMITSSEQGSVASQVSSIQAMNSGGVQVVGAVEGPNESDADSNFSYNGQKFPAGTIAFQTDLYNAIVANSATKNLTVIGPSEGVTYSPGSNPMANGSLYPYCNLGCFHPYSYGGNPFSNRFGYDTIANVANQSWYYNDAQCASDSTDPAEFPTAFQVSQPPFSQYSGSTVIASRPMAATERGWFTGTAAKSVSQATFAKYIPRLFAEDFYDGIARTYSYEFMDEGTVLTNSEDNYGLLYSNFTQKPAYSALKNMITIISDPAGTNFSPGSLNYSVAVTPPANYQASIALHHLLLEQSNGTFQLLLWNDISSSSLTDTSGNVINGTARDISPPTFTTTITVLTPTVSIAINNIDTSGNVETTPVTLVNNAFTVNVPDNLMIINLATVAPPATDTPTLPPLALLALAAIVLGFAGRTVQKRNAGMA